VHIINLAYLAWYMGTMNKNKIKEGLKLYTFYTTTVANGFYDSENARHILIKVSTLKGYTFYSCQIYIHNYRHLSCDTYYSRHFFMTKWYET